MEGIILSVVAVAIAFTSFLNQFINNLLLVTLPVIIAVIGECFLIFLSEENFVYGNMLVVVVIYFTTFSIIVGDRIVKMESKKTRLKELEKIVEDNKRDIEFLKDSLNRGTYV